MTCTQCNGYGYVWANGEKKVCNKCGGNGIIEQTNEEWLRSCSQFELIELLADLIDSAILRKWCIERHCADDERRAVELWLKEKHNA